MYVYGYTYIVLFSFQVLVIVVYEKDYCCVRSVENIVIQAH